MLITTTEVLQGAEITEYMGIISAASLDRFFVGDGKFNDSSLDNTITPIAGELKSKAEKIGADAVVGVQFAITGNYVRAFGTAVKLK